MNKKTKQKRLKLLMHIITDKDNANHIWSLAHLTATLNSKLYKSCTVSQGTMVSLLKVIPPSSCIRTFKNNYKNINYYMFREVLKCQKTKTM